MPVDQGLGYLSLAELTGLMRRREVSPVEVIDQVLENLDAVNPRLNAVVHRLDGAARAQAAESERRILVGEARALEGIPVPIKDNVLLAGAPMTLASRMAPDVDSPVDAEVVARLRAAGAVFPGKTNLPEFGTIPSTEGARLGACHNPWDVTRTPGGSSGGSAAVVAAGVVAAAHGNDGGGSLRIPSACCNLFSLKPTRGMVSKAPLDDDGFGLSIDGFLTRTVRDNATLLDEIAGSATGDWQFMPFVSGTYAAAAEREPGVLRIAVLTRPPVAEITVHPAHARAASDAGALCAELGHHVEQLDVELGGDELIELFMKLWANLIAQGMELLAAVGGDTAQAEPHNRALHAMASSMTAPEFTVAFASIRSWARRTLEMMAAYDVVITPTLCEPPLVLGRIFEGADIDPLAPMRTAVVLAGYTAAHNVTGQPAVNLPLFMHDGLPVGVMAAAAPGQDAMLISLSAQLEAALPWAQRRAPIHA